MIYAVLSHFDFVAKFTVKNLNKDFTNTERERDIFSSLNIVYIKVEMLQLSRLDGAS